MVNYLDLAKRARRDSQGAPRAINFRSSPPRLAKTGETILDARRDKSDRSDQNHPSERAQLLTVEEALEEMERPLSGPGMQARLYRAGEINRENAIEWITCAIIYRQMSGEARREARERWEVRRNAWQKGKKRSELIFFEGWQRHAKAVEEALDHFCKGGDEHKAG